MPTEIRIEHRYPDALTFLHRHGPDAVAVIHDLLAQSRNDDGQLVVQASVRQVAERLGLLSKDTVNRRMRALLPTAFSAASSSTRRLASRHPPTC